MSAYLCFSSNGKPKGVVVKARRQVKQPCLVDRSPAVRRSCLLPLLLMLTTLQLLLAWLPLAWMQMEVMI